MMNSVQVLVTVTDKVREKRLLFEKSLYFENWPTASKSPEEDDVCWAIEDCLALLAELHFFEILS